jgi:hypothetical protein
MYIYNYGLGYWASYNGWYGMSISLDTDNVGRQYRYGGMNDLSNVWCIRWYMYGYRYMSNLRFDHVGISQVDPHGDPITDSVVNSGDMGGRWTSTYSSPSENSHSYVGDYSIGFPVRSYRRETFTYTFDAPTDMSTFDSVRFYTWFSAYRYTRWYNYQFYVYSATGYGYYYIYGSSYINYYATNYDNRWDMRSLPWGPQSGLYRNYGVDWTQITQIRIDEVYSYRTSTFLIDGFDWIIAGEGGPSGPTDTVSLAIYNEQGDTTIHGNSVIKGLEKMGARIVTYDGTSTLQNADFDNMWATYTTSAGNGLNIWGGYEGFGNAVVNDVNFLNCQGPGMALMDGQFNCQPATIDLTGAALKMKQAPKLIMGCSDATAGAFNLDISGWTADNSPGGVGILAMFYDTTASIDLTISGNEVDGNKYAGIIISNYGGGSPMGLVQGPTADLDVTIKDQVVEDAGAHGIVYYAGMGDWAPNIWGTLTVDNVTVRKSGEYGLVMYLDIGCTNLDAYIANSTFDTNGESGIMTVNNGFFGKANIDIFNITSLDNGAAGIEFYGMMNPWDDGNGNRISPVSEFNVDINSSVLKSNAGWGIVERFNGMDNPEGGDAPPWNWNGPTRTTLYFNITMRNMNILENVAGGWKSKPDEGWSHGNYWTMHDMIDSSIDDNRGTAGVYIEPEHDLWGGTAEVMDVWIFDNSRIIDNTRGLYHWLGSSNYGYQSEIHIDNTRIEGNDEHAILIDGPTSTDGVHTWGTSRVLSSMIYVDQSRMNSPVSFEMTGADDGGNPDWDAKFGVQFTNNVVDVEDEDIVYLLSAYPWCEDFLAWGDVGANRFFRGFAEHGIDVTMYGGWNLEMDFTFRDQKIDEPGGSGLNFLVGTLIQSIDPHSVFGTVSVENVTVSNARSNGVNFTVDQREIIGSKSRGVFEMHDVVMDGVQYGIFASDISGAIYDSTIVNNALEAVYIKFSVFDFYSCEVGDVSTDNIRVFTKGAARMWFDVAVDVKWASGAYVLGAVVSMQDNTWSTIGVDTVGSPAELPFGYVNSYTVLPDSVYSRSPYLVSATFLGLETQERVDIDKNMVVDLVLVDDVLPRLTVNAPMDGSSQTDTSMEVKGYAWDMHSGLEVVQVSVDGVNWFNTTGEPEFTYTFNMVPEGNLMLMVRAIDYAGNERMEYVAVLVDATPPAILIIEPTLDIFMTQNEVLDIIGVTELGATVTVNNDPVTMDLTLFHTTLTLKEGYNEVHVVAKDMLGNRAEHVIKATLDTIAPPLIVTEPIADDVLGVRSTTVNGQTEIGARVTVNGVVVANVGGMFSTRVTLFEGPNVILVTATDAVGNLNTIRVPVVVDTLEPWLELVSPMDGDVYGEGGILVRGWVEEGSTVLVNDREFSVTAGYFMGYAAGSEGDFPITITVIDQAGNTMSETVSVMVDLTAPTIVLTAPEDGTMTSEDSIEISGKLMWDDREEFRDISLLMNGQFAPFAATGEFKVKYELAEGTNPIVIRTEDDVGNEASMVITVIRDSKAPFLLAVATPTFDHPEWNKPSTYRNIVYIDGFTEPGASVTVDGAEVDVDETGYFNVSVLLDNVPEGEELVHRAVMVEATDAADNSNSETIDVYRLAVEEEEKDFFSYENPQYWVLLLSILILVGAIVAAALLLRRLGRPPEEEYYDDEYEGGM